MRTFISIVTIFFNSFALGQSTKVTSIPILKNYKNEIDTTIWFKWKSALAKQINLQDLQNTTDTFHFRFWTDIQALDIWTLDHKTYFGIVTNYAQRYDNKLIKKGIYQVDKIFSNQIKIDSSKARKIFNVIERLSIIDIPTDDKIVGWRQGFDGQEFIIEISTSSLYSFKTYWSPRTFIHALKEAQQIQALVDNLYADFKIYEYYQKLELPEGLYQRNGVQGIPIRMTDQYKLGVWTIADLL